MNDTKNSSAINNPRLFEEEFRKWYTPLCKMSFRYVKDKQAAEDIVQDVFIKLWKQRSELTLSHSLKAYLYRAIINSSINYLEKNKKKYFPKAEEWTAIDKGEKNTEEKVNYNMLLQEVDNAINLLPPECKKVFTLSRYEGMSNKEIAEILNISVKTVENQMTKALSILRKNLALFLKNSVLLLFLFNT